MSRMSREKGYRTEAAVVAYLRDHGFPHCCRRSSGAAGADIDELGPGLEIEVKNRAKWDLSGWLDQLADAMEASESEMGAVIVKRAGTTDVGSWWFVQTAGLWNQMIGGTRFNSFTVRHKRMPESLAWEFDWATTQVRTRIPSIAINRRGRNPDDHYSITTVGHGVRLLRAAGWGIPLEVDA